MLRHLTFAAAILALSAGLARAQVTGPIPNTGLDVGRDFNWGGWSTDETSRAPTARDIEIERRYRETVSAKSRTAKPRRIRGGIFARRRR